jgi:hypothetical protein
MRICRKLQAFVLAGVLSFAGQAVAQSPGSEALVAARELVVAMRATEQIKTILPLVMRQIKPAIVQGRPQVERDYDAIVPQLLNAVTAQTGDFVELIALVYARNLSIDEMQQAATFYRSPVGQKLLEKMPTISRESALAGQVWGQTLLGDLRALIIEELRKRGHDI